MSGRVRQQSDCPIGKQGPMRATVPVASLVKQSGGLRKSCGNSPTLSPTSNWRRASPEHSLSGQRSPGAVNYKGRIRNDTNLIRRTASLDAIHQRSHWPRDSFYLHNGLLQMDKATQTEDTAGAGAGRWGSTPPGGSSSEDKLDRLIRHHRLQRSSARPTPTPPHHEHASQTMSPVFFSAIKSGASVPLRAARSSVEGLNQEIERLVLCPTPPLHIDRHRDKATPEGHRAPLAELLRRSVNTQTPAQPDSQSHSAQSSGGSVCSSPDPDSNKMGTSPHINRFLAREPPDGCERVSLSAGGGNVDMGDISPIRPSVGFQLRASQGSAFQPLQPPAPPLDDD